MGAVVTLFLFSLQLSADTEALRKMEPWIAACIERDDTESPIFHGCVDWHSAAHAHWALFRIARATGKNTKATWLAEKRLSPARISEEQHLLRKSLTFENPYGRAWFLRLVIDFEAWARSNEVALPSRLREMADEVAQSILEYYESRPITPASREYQNASWAFYHLTAYSDFIDDSDLKSVIDPIVDSRFVESEETLSFSADAYEFFSLFGNWVYLVGKTRSRSVLDGFLQRHPIPASSLSPIKPATAHSMGLNWSRAWAFKVLSLRVSTDQERARYLKAYQNHVAKGLSDHERFKSDYQSYGHWVPQFAVYALTESTVDHTWKPN